MQSSLQVKMETPEALTLSEQKQKSTLSAKKNKKKDKRVRTMFASPYNPYWLVQNINITLLQYLLNYWSMQHQLSIADTRLQVFANPI